MQRFISFDWLPDARISPLDHIGVQSVQESRIDGQGKLFREKSVQLRQIMNLREVDPVKHEQRLEIFLTALLGVETDGVPGNLFRSEIILNVQQIYRIDQRCAFDPV